MTTRKKSLSKDQAKFRLSAEARSLVVRASDVTGYTMSLLIELLIRQHLPAIIDKKIAPVTIEELTAKPVRTPKPKQEPKRKKEDDFTGNY